MKKYIKLIVLIVVTLLITIELPYQDRTIAQYLIPNIPFRGGQSLLSLAGILPLIGVIMVVKEFQKVTDSGSNGIFVFLMILFLITPALRTVDSIIKTPFYNFSSGVSSYEIKDSEMNIYAFKDLIDYQLTLSIDIKEHKQLNEGADIYVEIPPSAQEYFQEKRYLVHENVNLSRDEINLKGVVTMTAKPDKRIPEHFPDMNQSYLLIIKDKNGERIWKRNDDY